MALSDWATMAWNDKGEACEGQMTFPGDITIEIYKCWVYIKDPKGWTKNVGLREPTVMEIWEGIVHYKGLNIFVKRGLRRAVYLVCEFRDYKDGEIDSITQLFGIGVSGFSKDKYIGVDKKNIIRFKRWLSNKKYFSGKIWALEQVPKLKGTKQYNQGDMFFNKNADTGIPLSEKPQEPVLVTMLKGGIKKKARKKIKRRKSWKKN